MEERNFHKDGIIYSAEVMFSIIHDWAMENLINSTANATHFNILGWLDSMIRRAASKVPLLHNKLQSIPFYNVTLLKAAIINYFRQTYRYPENEGWKGISLPGDRSWPDVKAIFGVINKYYSSLEATWM